MHVFLTGATGLIGRAVARALLERGEQVTALSRAPGGRGRLPPGTRAVVGDPVRPGRWQEELLRADACVHLAGEPLDRGRWNAERRRVIRESRIASTRCVAEVLGGAGPRVLVCGSAVGVYGDRGDEELDESAAPGSGFLAELGQEWEAAATPARGRARVVALRTGIVLARDGGALPRMTLPFRLFAGGPLGDGRFWQPWIHLADEVGLILLSLEHPGADGPLNAVAPNPVQNRDLARAIGKALNRPSVLPAPALALRMALGELASEVLASQRAVPRKALGLGYRFRFPEVTAALRDLLG
ncbi:MAG TPA: TIGR01777 family oxidoreductase [Anaeromyxobacter sp.]|nr:TIGR01777 family oxidoreductase [Anaeromyxobacter sp.]